MEILVPIDTPEQAAPLAKAGATEFYFGFLGTQWLKKYTNPQISETNIQIGPNRRVVKNANLETLDDIKELVDKSHHFHIPVYLAVNNPSYIEENYPGILGEIHSMVDFGIDGLIISDPGLLFTITSLNLNLKIMLSTLTQVANCEAICFFRELGVSCITFPRYITLEEIEHITNQIPEMEYECFMMEDRCTYEDGNCNPLHCTEDFFCEEQWVYDFVPTSSLSLTYEEYQKLRLHEDQYKEWIMPYPNLEVQKEGWQNTGCGICAIPFLIQKTRITGLKIAGRGASMEQKLKALWLVSEAIKLAEQDVKPEQIKEMARDAQFLPELCNLRYRCYFPDVFDI